MTDLERKLAAFRPSWERLGAPADRLGLWTSQQLIRDARRLKERGLLETRYRGGCLDWRLTASAIEAATAGETTQIGSTEGESAVAATSGETPEPGPVQDDDLLHPHSTASHAVAPEDVERMDRPSQKAGATCRDPRPSVQDDETEANDDICARCGERIDFRPGESFMASVSGEVWHMGCAPSLTPTADHSLVEARPQGDAGDAIDYALGHCVDEDAIAFLDEWRADRADKWPGYMKWLNFQRKCAAESKANRLGKQSADDRG